MRGVRVNLVERRYAIVTSGGRIHVGWWWEPTNSFPQQDGFWWTLCGRTNGAFKETDGPADCRRCFKAMDRETIAIEGKVAYARSVRDAYEREIEAGARLLASLDQMFAPDFEQAMEDGAA